jgi:hypothetical protein
MSEDGGWAEVAKDFVQKRAKVLTVLGLMVLCAFWIAICALCVDFCAFVLRRTKDFTEDHPVCR